MKDSFDKLSYWSGVYQRSGLRNHGLSIDQFMTDPWEYVVRFGVHDESFPKLREVDLTSARRPTRRSLPRSHHRRAPVISIDVARKKPS